MSSGPSHYNRLAAFLKREPQPAKIVVTVDGDEQVITPPPKGPKNHRQWREKAEMIESLGASRVKLLGDDGEILRMQDFDVDAKEKDGGEETAAAKEYAKAFGRFENALAASVDRIAARQCEAFDKGAGAVREAFMASHDALVSLVEMLCGRLAGLEEIVHSQVLRNAEESSGSDGVIGKVLEIAAARAGAPNGAAKSRRTTEETT